jgi:hypothetical protein
MNIFINDVEVETQLDKEENLGQIFDEVHKWAESQGKFLVRCLKDGEELSRDELLRFGLEQANRMDFYVGENMDVLVSTLLELDKYIDAVGSTLLGRDSLTEKETKDLGEGVKWILEVLEIAKRIMNLNLDHTRPVPEGKSVSEILNFITDNSGVLHSFSGIEIYLEYLRDLKLFIMNLINKASALTVDVQTLQEIIRAYSQNMEVLKNEFIRVNENLQSGKDVLAGELLSHSTGRLQVLLSALISLQARDPEATLEALKIEDKTLKDITEKLKTLLGQIADALDSGDMVMAGDLLEYELPDVLEELVPFLSAIHKLK